MKKRNDRPKNGDPGFVYDETPMMQDFAAEEDSCFAQVNRFGTYEVQRTADTDEFFPAIAQGLPSDADFAIRTKNITDPSEQ